MLSARRPIGALPAVLILIAMVAASAPTSSGAPGRSGPTLHADLNLPAHSASVAVFGSRTKTSGCHVHGQLPDRSCTPGAILTQATVSRICTPGYSRSVRNVSDSLRAAVFAEYGIGSHSPGSYEVDHLVPLELGGSNAISNLWPEVAPGYHGKDSIENRLHRAVCARSLSLREAQREMARDWRHTFVGGSGPYVYPPTSPRTTPTPTPSPSGPPPGATARCRDGSYSFSQHRSGTCSYHGGVAEWL